MVWNAASGYQSSTTIKGKLAAFSAAFLLLVSSLTSGISPFMDRVSAAKSYTQVPFTESELANWTTDRSVPSGGIDSVSYGGRDYVLEMAVDNQQGNPSENTFYSTEGLKRDTSGSHSVKADLFVDTSWFDKDVRSGLWGVGKDSQGTVTAYPVIEFTTAGEDGFIGWRTFDGVNGGWTNHSEGHQSGGWHTVRLDVNPISGEIELYLNDKLLDSYDGDGTSQIGEVILNSYNYETGDSSENYQVHWSSFAYGVDPDPTNSNVLRLSGDVYRDVKADNCDSYAECKTERTGEMLAGWEMRLYKESQDGSWDFLKSAKTNQDGAYNLGSHQESGVYHVCEVLEPGWTQSAQNWSGSGYLVNTPNQSGEESEGPYCTTKTYSDLGDNSSVSHFGNVDNLAPAISNIKIEPQADNGNIGGTVKVSFDMHDATGVDAEKTKVFFSDGANDDHRKRESAKCSPVNVGGNRYEAIINTRQFVDNNYSGFYNLAFNKYDTLGNHSSAKPKSHRMLLVDNSGPGFSVISHDNGSYVNGETTVIFSANDQTGVASGYAKLVNLDTEQEQSRSISRNIDDTWSATFDTAALEDGNYKIDVRPIDTFGTPRYNSDRGRIVVDNTGPNIVKPVTFEDGKSAEGSTVNGVVTLRVVQSEQNPRKLYVEYMEKDVDGVWRKKQGKEYYSNEALFTVDTTKWNDGEHKIKISSSDMAWNKAGHSFLVNVDNSGPVIESASLEKVNAGDVTSAQMNETGKLKLTIVTNEPILDWKSQVFLMRTAADGGAITLPRAHFAESGANTYEAHLDLNEGALAGSHTDNMRLRIKLYDSLLNGAPWTYLTLDGTGSYAEDAPVYRFTVDNAAPVVEAGQEQEAQLLSATLNGDGGDGMSYQWVMVDGPGVPVFDNPNLLNTGVTVSEFGSYVFELTSTDAAQNISSDQVAIKFTQPLTSNDGDERDQDGEQLRSDRDDSQGTPTATSVLNGLTNFGIVGQGFAIGGGAVLGETDQNDEEQSDQESGNVFAATTANETSSQSSDEESGCSKFLGLCWYWWAPIAVVIFGIVYAAVRSRREV